ncbi:MAG: DUF417 family protein [Cyanobacteria bacterium 0813]|nr:DUF417 family protein [Cyanobacteria bacterium 0813]MDP8934540.1 DUF417 family protein [Cyanobacteriota bacterium]
MKNKTQTSNRLQNVGLLLVRYGVVLILIWVGLLKFTPMEAEGIRPFVENSPLLSWMYRVMSIQAASDVIGVIEVTAAVLMAARRWSAIASAIGSAMAVITFLFTLSFLFSTPKVVDPAFPGISAFPGQFLMKDVLLLGGALWSLGESLEALNNHRDGDGL